MLLLGIDAGNARVKVCGPAGAIDFDAALGEWRQRNLVNSHGPDDMEIAYAGKRHFAGGLARRESEFGGCMMGCSKAHEEARIRVLLAIARHGANRCSVVTGQPISSHVDHEKERIVRLLEGDHEITVNGKLHRILIAAVKVAAEGAAAFWSAPASGLVRIVDVGSGTVNCATILDYRYVDRDSFTLPYGFDSTISTDRSAMADGIAREALKKWHRGDRVYLVGGGAESIAPHLQRHFPAAEILRPGFGGRQLHPCYANAVGYYQLAEGLL